MTVATSGIARSAVLLFPGGFVDLDKVDILRAPWVNDGGPKAIFQPLPEHIGSAV